MQPDRLAVLIAGTAGIIFTYWFFFMKKQDMVSADGEVDIEVMGGYRPESISIPFGRETRLNFVRKDPSSCLEEVVVPEFRIKRYLPLNEKVTITVTPGKRGTFGFECGMGMYHGKLTVK